VAVLPSLVTVADFAAEAGYTFGPAEEVQAHALLRRASGVVRRYLRLDVSRATTTDTFRLQRADHHHFAVGSGGTVTLPQRPVEDVAEVSVNGVLTYDWWLEDVTLLVRSAPWDYPPAAHGPPEVDVTYTHGWDPVPDDIAAIVMQAANRAMTNPGQVRSEAVGGESTTYLIPSSGEALGVLLSRTEQRTLDRYRRTAGSMRMRPA